MASEEIERRLSDGYDSDTVQITVTRKVLDEFQRAIKEHHGIALYLCNDIAAKGYRSAREIRVEVVLTEEDVYALLKVSPPNASSWSHEAINKLAAAASAALKERG